MFHQLLGLIHAHLVHAGRRLQAQAGQGTVEYVALVLLVAGVFAAVVTAAGKKDFELTDTIVGKLKDAIDGVSAKKS